MEKPRFKKSTKKKKCRDAAFLMYFPYTEALLPFQPASLKRKGSSAHPSKSGTGKQHAHDSESEEELEYIPERIDLASKLRQILRDEDSRMERIDDERGQSYSRSSSLQESECVDKKKTEYKVATTYSQFLLFSPPRCNSRDQALRRSHATQPSIAVDDLPKPEEVWDRCTRRSTSPYRGASPPKSEQLSVCLQSPLRLPSVRKELPVVRENTAQSFPSLAFVPPISLQQNVLVEPSAAEVESIGKLPEKPKTCNVRVRKHKQPRNSAKSPRAKTPVQASKAVTASAVILESRQKTAQPPVVDRTDQQHREMMLDVLLRNKTSQDHAMLMQEYVKRIGLPEQTRVFILYSQDDYMRRALRRRGWHENKMNNSTAFHLKWTYTDCDLDYHSLRPGQLFNHFPNNRKLTTKCGLSSCFRINSDCQILPDTFYPRTYDIGDNAQVEELRQDYERTAVLSVVKQHAEYFLTLPQRPQGQEVSLVNRPCLKVAMKHCRQLIHDLTDKCEHVSRYSFVPDTRRPFCSTKEDWRFLMEYSKLRLPFSNISEETRLLCGRKTDWSKVWVLPQRRSMDKCIALYYQMLSSWPQAVMEGSRNVWIVKPGQNARGSGVHCTDDLQEIVGCGAKLQARIVQKYIERPLLLNLPKGKVKFDIRQWVLVTSLDPLEVYVFNSCYLRLCTQPFSLDDLKDQFRHLANYSVQKTAKSSADTVWSLGQFLVYLAQRRPDVSWRADVQPLIHSLILNTLHCVSDELDPRPGCFELYGFDIILDEGLKPWLLEVNLSPACAERTPWLTTMLDAMSDGLLSIVLDGTDELPIIDSSRVVREVQRIDTFEWVLLYKGESAPADGRDQPPCNLEIIGEKVNVRKERLLERRFWKEQAAILIQKYVRGFLIRNRNKAERRARAAVVVQKHVRRFLAKRELARRRLCHSVLRVQSLYRRLEAHEALLFLRKVKVVTKLQSLYRRWKAKEMLHNLRQNHCAQTIQCVWRRQLSRWRVASSRDYLRKVQKIQRLWRLRLRRVCICAVIAQRFWRGVLGRRVAARWRARVKCMLQLQCVTRSMLAKQVLRNVQESHAVSIIQQQLRSHLAAVLVSSLNKHKAATFIQRKYRSYKSRKAFLRLRRAKLARIRAAVRIQSVVKGFMVREHYRLLLRAKAATTIQRVFRGHICRVYYKIMRQRCAAAVLIQRRFRGHCARRRFEMMKRSKAQEQERARRKEQMKREQLARGLAATERLAQRSGDASARQTPVVEVAKPPVLQTARHTASRSGEPKLRTRNVTPPHPPSTSEALELLSRPTRPKTRVKTGSHVRSVR